jgi:hypothetical protein
MKTHKQFDKLAEQCYVKTGSVQTDHFDYVKFAELIVRECAKVSERTGALNEADFEGEMIADAIKEHFGVDNGIL